MARVRVQMLEGGRVQRSASIPMLQPLTATPEQEHEMGTE